MRWKTVFKKKVCADWSSALGTLVHVTWWSDRLGKIRKDYSSWAWEILPIWKTSSHVCGTWCNANLSLQFNLSLHKKSPRLRVLIITTLMERQMVPFIICTLTQTDRQTHTHTCTDAQMHRCTQILWKLIAVIMITESQVGWIHLQLFHKGLLVDD